MDAGRCAGLAAILVAAAVSLAGPPAADAATTLRQQLSHCATIADDDRRLACYDALAADGNADEQASAADAGAEPSASEADSPRAQPPVAERSPEENFGIETLPVRVDDDGEAVDAIESTIAGLRQRPYGEYIFVLENGQTWTQLEKGRVRYREGQEVTIERTTLGAYMLYTPNGRASRVRRLD